MTQSVIIRSSHLVCQSSLVFSIPSVTSLRIFLYSHQRCKLHHAHHNPNTCPLHLTHTPHSPTPPLHSHTHHNHQHTSLHTLTHATFTNTPSTPSHTPHSPTLPLHPHTHHIHQHSLYTLTHTTITNTPPLHPHTHHIHQHSLSTPSHTTFTNTPSTPSHAPHSPALPLYTLTHTPIMNTLHSTPSQAWAKPKRRHLAHNFLRLVERMNNITLWMATNILSQKDVNDRAKRVVHFAQVAHVSVGVPYTVCGGLSPCTYISTYVRMYML